MRTIVLSLLAILIAPAASADFVCAPLAGGEACADYGTRPDGGHAYAWATTPDGAFVGGGAGANSRANDAGLAVFVPDGTFVAVGAFEGSGFFGDTATAYAFAHVPAGERFAVLIVALNDGHPRDGLYEYAAVVVDTWTYEGDSSAGAAAGATDSDGDGLPDSGGAFHDAYQTLA